MGTNEDNLIEFLRRTIECKGTYNITEPSDRRQEQGPLPLSSLRTIDTQVQRADFPNNFTWLRSLCLEIASIRADSFVR